MRVLAAMPDSTGGLHVSSLPPVHHVFVEHPSSVSMQIGLCAQAQAATLAAMGRIQQDTPIQ